jgi:hypothetical protein
MAYGLQVEFSPSYEMIASGSIFMKRNLSRHLLYGDQWIKEVESKIGEELKSDLLAFEDLATWTEYLLLLAHFRVNLEETQEEFLQWVEGIQAGELFELLAPYSLNPIQPHIGSTKSQFVDLFYRWNDFYFKGFEAELLEVLKRDSVEKGKLSEALSPQEAFERITDIVIEEEAPVDQILLVPSIHVNPIKIIHKYNRLNLIYYPVDPPVKEGEVPHQLRRITKALNDDNRVKMLRLIAQGPRTFTEIVNGIGLSKATVHQHLFTLRSAGLLRFHYYQDTYSINPNLLTKINGILGDFIF